MESIKMISSLNANEDNKKSTLQLFGINSLICGVEMASSFYFAYIPPMLLKGGYSNSAMTIILGIAPIANLLTAPILAKWSDGCSSKYGRRKPFILVISTIMTFSILLIPTSSYFINKKIVNLGTNIFIPIIAVILFSYSYHAIFNPCMSLLVDLSVSKSCLKMDGFRIYSTCMLLGCVLGYLVAAVEWKLAWNVFSKQEVSFLVVAVFLNVCLLVSLSFAKEKPYVDNSCDITRNLEENHRSNETSYKMRPIDEHVKDTLQHQGICGSFFKSKFLRRIKSVFLKGFSSILSSILKILRLPLRGYQHIKMSSSVIQKLFLTELFGWMSCLCHSMFFTVFVSENFFHGTLNADNTSRKVALYDEGVHAGSWMLFLQSVTACVYALFVQHHLVTAIGLKIIFVGELSIFASCMLATVVSPSIRCLNAVTALSGIGSVALSTFPGMLVSLYNEDRKLYLWDDRNNINALVDLDLGVGSDVAVLDMAFFLSQIILALVVGPLVDLCGSPLLYMIFAFGAGVCAVGFGRKVVCSPVDLDERRFGSNEVLIV